MSKALTVQGAIHNAAETPAVALLNLDGKGLRTIEGNLKDIMAMAESAGKSSLHIKMEGGVANVLSPSTDNLGHTADKPRGWHDYQFSKR